MQEQHQPLPKIKGVQMPQQPKSIAQKKQSLEEQTKSILSQLDQLANSIPLAAAATPQNDNETNNDNNESKFLSAVHKECIPGRDDSSGEINPTTHRKRECLRHVPLQKNGLADWEERTKRQRPRIGIMIPPGYISTSFANWVSNALKHTGDGIQMDIEILITSHVPVYGYGKSHGYTKLIRFVTLPLALAVYDVYLFASSNVASTSEGVGDGNNDYYQDSSLRDALDEIKLGRNLSPPAVGTLGKILQLVLRWHCRLSHVSAHTAMLTVSLEDVVKDPKNILASILGFVWREDWEWEGHGGKHNHQGALPPRNGGWTREAEDLVIGDDHRGDSSLQRLMGRTARILQESTSSARDGNSSSFSKAIQGAFASEMKRSSGMTSWPCPSFWEGVDSSSGGTGGNNADSDGGDGHNQMRMLQLISGEMIPNCSDDDPFSRCTVNKDRCEVNRDAKCK
ncbi:hypothetical protein ACHAXR_005217 [Thalassiosira sp. AJA248-18]